MLCLILLLGNGCLLAIVFTRSQSMKQLVARTLTARDYLTTDLAGESSVLPRKAAITGIADYVGLLTSTIESAQDELKLLLLANTVGCGVLTFLCASNRNRSS